MNKREKEPTDMPISFWIYTFFIVFTAFSFIRRGKHTQYIGYFISYLLFFTYIALSQRFALGYNDILNTLVVLTGFIHFFFGENLGYYYRAKQFDRLLHCFGTFSFTLFLNHLIVQMMHPALQPDAFLFVYILSLGTAIGAFFELFEFLADTLFHSRNQSGLVDTNVDLLFDVIGAMLAAIVAVFVLPTP